MEMVARNVKALLDDSTFLLAPQCDDQVRFHFYLSIMTLIAVYQGRSSNFALPAIIELCKKFYYSGKPDALATFFPTEFTTMLPCGCLAMVCTAVSFILFVIVVRLVIIVDCELPKKWKWGHILISHSAVTSMNQSTTV